MQMVTFHTLSLIATLVISLKVKRIASKTREVIKEFLKSLWNGSFYTNVFLVRRKEK